jgi:hypothetical protein
VRDIVGNYLVEVTLTSWRVSFGLCMRLLEEQLLSVKYV